MFDLKSGFKFEDKGHPNEQITWLTKGKMSFYAKDQKDILFENSGISVGQIRFMEVCQRVLSGLMHFFQNVKKKI